MGLRAFAAVVAAILLSLPPAGRAADYPLQFYTEEYPPITFSRAGKAAGLATDIVEEIMRRTGIAAPIEVVPWARAYKLATTGPNVGLFATTRTEEREKLFKWVGPISATTAHFYSRKGAPIYDTLEQARRAERILIPREWYLQQMLRGLGFTNIHGVATPVEAVKMLAAGRATVMALDDVTLADTLNATGVSAADIQSGGTITQAIQYIAFSRDTPDELVQLFQRTLDTMKADGTYDRIYTKWLPGVKPPVAMRR